MWIPYYQASGFSDWKELGFDMACMQPNYAFTGTATIDRLYDNAATTKRLGMCVEIEINQYDSKSDILRYKEYLAVGAETGYMNAVKCYYQGGVPVRSITRISPPIRSSIRFIMTRICLPRANTIRARSLTARLPTRPTSSWIPRPDAACPAP